MNHLHQKRSVGLLPDEYKDVLRRKEQAIVKQKQHLRNLEKSRDRSKKVRETRKRSFEEAFGDNPELQKKMKIRNVFERPRLEEDQL